MIVKYYVVLSLQLYSVLSVDTCGARKTCKECLLDSQICAWCGMNDFTGTRCRSSSIKDNWCPELLQNPNSTATRIDNLPFNSTPGHVVQIRPQKYTFHLRPGQYKDFKFSFQGAAYFPVDVYFLFDASRSMLERRESTAAQSKSIYDTLKHLTKDVRLGLGAFVDKKAYPYTNFQGEEETYSFRHYLSLIDDQEVFKKKVENIPLGGNFDDQEGGLDALAQVITCNELIDWRNGSRKIIVLLTDGPYHAVGDGRSAGLIQPYDGKCYTYKDTYTEELTMDYPSASMINKLATENDIIVIFLVDCEIEKQVLGCTEIQEIYRNLSAVIRGSKCAFIESKSGKSTNDGGVVDILVDIYKEISRKVNLKVNVNNGKRTNYEIHFNPNCTHNEGGSDCDIKIGEEKQFSGTIRLVEYNGVPNASIDVVLEGIGEKLTLDINVINDCNSSCPSQNNSDYCHGELRHCGACICGESRFGDTCACQKSGKVVDNCIATGSDVKCSGHGKCACGSCSCDYGYGGDYCECNKNSCPLGANDLPCSGPDHGDCTCDPISLRSNCSCSAVWSGDACDCYKLEDGCKADGSNVNCNGRGFCNCGSCECYPIAAWDKRNSLDDLCRFIPCAECHAFQCQALEDCARCKYSAEHYCPVCIEGVNASVQDIVPQDTSGEGWKLCNAIRVGVGCYAHFSYRYDDVAYAIDLAVQSHGNCAEIHYMIGGISVGAVLIIGLVTLVGWKLLTDARDRREYEEFAKRHQDCAPEITENPLYSTPETSK